MTRDELLAIALRHGFGHCEVGIRMLGLVHEIIESCAQDCEAMAPKRQLFETDKQLAKAAAAIRKRITG